MRFSPILVLATLLLTSCHGDSDNGNNGETCIPQCNDGQQCGSDGCDGVCGVCEIDQMCSANFTCVDADDDSVACRDLSDLRQERPTGDLYVAVDGSDENDGRSYETPFATIQRGVSALQAGETLIIGPGEYFGSVSRGTFIEWEFGDQLGSPDVDTVIRAEIPGTVLIRGDVPSPSFTKLDGYDHIYVADYPGDTEIITVNELDSFRVLPERVSLNLLEYLPGSFYQDQEGGKVYLSTSDYRSADEHRFSFSLIQDHGFALTNATRVIVDGLSVTGFNMGKAIYSWNDFTAYSVWGILLRHSEDCVVRNSRVFFNARGIGVTSTTRELPFGGNVIENCQAWGNDSPVSTEDTGGISMNRTIGDTVRNSVAYLNGGVGINIYADSGDGSPLAAGDRSVFSHDLSWGNEYADYKIKAGEDGHYTEYSIGLGIFSHTTNPDHCLVGTTANDPDASTIIMADEVELDRNAEFVDPENFDFRLQSTSRFRGAMSNGSDRGPLPFRSNVFFVAAEGSDDNDGMSLSTAWRTFAHAEERLEAGDTLYIVPGTYDEDIDWSLGGTEEEPISIRGRGEEPVVLRGQWSVLESKHVDLQRLTFEKVLRIEGTQAVSVEGATFLAEDRGILATNSVGLEVTHSTFTGFSSSALSLPCSVDSHLAGNLYDNTSGPALVARDDAAVGYSDYNSYAQGDDAWTVNGETLTFDSVQSDREPHSLQQAPVFTGDGATPVLENEREFSVDGPARKPIGAYRLAIPKREMRLADAPKVHSLSSTTANIEWTTTLPAAAAISWGPTEAMDNTLEYTAQSFATLSLTGLAPNTTYYFKINTLTLAEDIELEVDPLTVSEPALTFTTPAADAAAQNYYVSTTGSDTNDGLSQGSAWRTIQHAADQVNVGDTVYIAGGIYPEQVYIRATGADAARPITFRNQPSEKVVLDGLSTLLSNGFVVAGKNHLNFDGLYFHDHGDSNPWAATFTPAQGGDFNIYRSDYVTISRCLGYTVDFQHHALVARETKYLTLDNVAYFNHFTSLYLHYVENTVVTHSVIARPWIYALLQYLPWWEDTTNLISDYNHSIFTDSFAIKAEANVPLFYAGAEEFVQSDCVYLLRDGLDPSWRLLTSETTGTDTPASYVNPLFVDPQFAAVEELRAAGAVDESEFSADVLMSVEEFNFDSFYATNPTVMAREIGLEPSRFDGNGVPN